MTTFTESVFDKAGNFQGLREFIRGDTVRDRHGYYYVPTTEKTKWISSWEEFKAAGGIVQWNYGQSEVTLKLPEPYKFTIRFNGGNPP